MKRKAPILLSAFIVSLTFVFVANFSGVRAIEEGSETTVTTTKTTTVKVETTTKLTWPWQNTSDSSTTVNVSSVLSSIGDELTGTKTTTTSSSASETHSEDGSETENPVKPGTTANVTTTKKVTTTVKKMTITVVINTTIPGGTMDPLSAYYSRLSETDENGELIENVETTDSNEQEERETNPAVTVIIAVAAMLIVISLMTGLFSLRNKKLAEKEAAQGIKDEDSFSGDVIISKKTGLPEFTQTVVEDEDDLISDEPLTDETKASEEDTDKPTDGGEAAGTGAETGEKATIDKPDDETVPATDSDIKDMKYDDIFSGRDDL